MKTLYVYTKKTCSGCNALKKFLDELYIPYVERDIDVDAAAYKKLRDDRHQTVPQVYADDQLFVRGGWNSIKTMRRDEIIDRLK